MFKGFVTKRVIVTLTFYLKKLTIIFYLLNKKGTCLHFILC